MNTPLRWLSAGSIALTLALGSGPSAAAESYYLQVTGLTGDSTDRAHKGWIDLTSFSWGLTATGTSGSSKASFSDFAWTQLVDKSTPTWFLDVASGVRLATTTLDVVGDTPSGQAYSYFQMVFKNTQAQSLAVSGAGSTPVASASMTSGLTVTLRYRPITNGAPGTWVEGSFDLGNNRTNAVFSGDPTALMGLFSSGGNINFDGSAVSVVPEPASAGLLAGGLVLLTARLQKRRRS